MGAAAGHLLVPVPGPVWRSGGGRWTPASAGAGLAQGKRRAWIYISGVSDNFVELHNEATVIYLHALSYRNTAMTFDEPQGAHMASMTSSPSIGADFSVCCKACKYLHSHHASRPIFINHRIPAFIVGVWSFRAYSYHASSAIGSSSHTSARCSHPASQGLAHVSIILSSST